MREITTKVYTFDELSETAQETAHENYLNSNNFEWGWTDENKDTLDAFEQIFPIKITNWEYDSNFYNVNFEFDYDVSDEIQELSGVRLATYLWNNYKAKLFKGKYYKTLKNNTEKVVHKRIKSKLLSNGKWFNSYYSVITLENSCVLTGYGLDDDILQPIYEFLNKPSGQDFAELIQDCLDNWGKACRDECESQLTMEYFQDLAEGNNYEFDENGERF